jgi:C4-dicarboxylate transporter DctM subunit
LRGTATLCDYVLVGVLLALVGVTAAGVVSRYLEGSPLAWTDECAGSLFAALTFVGAACGVWRGNHPSITLLTNRLPPSLQRACEGAALGLMIAFLAVVARMGIAITAQATAISMTSLPVAQAWSYAVVPAAALLMILFATRQFLTRRPGLIGVAASVATLALCWTLGVYDASGAAVYVYAVIALAAALLVGVPVAFALGVSAVLVLNSTDLPLDIVPQRLFEGTSNVILLAIPLFILTGTIMSAGGMALRLAAFATAVFGSIRGGLGIADIAASVVFADISGSAVADSAAIGSVMIPQLVARGYPIEFASALQAAAGSLGLMFPPSSTMIVYAWVTNISVATLFLHSFVPGLMVAVTFAVVVYIFARRRDYPREGRFSPRLVLTVGRQSALALLTPVVILVAILGGLTTPSEAGVIAAIYAALVSCVIDRSLKPGRLYAVLLEAALSASRITFIIAAAILLSWVLTAFQGPQRIGALLLRTTDNPILMLILINILMTVLHTMLEGLTTILVLVPVMLPVLRQLGIDLYVFGIIMAQNCALGLLLPPLGFNLYVISTIAGISTERVARAVVPFVIILALDVLALILWPGIATWLPRLLG